MERSSVEVEIGLNPRLCSGSRAGIQKLSDDIADGHESFQIGRFFGSKRTPRAPACVRGLEASQKK